MKGEIVEIVYEATSEIGDRKKNEDAWGITNTNGFSLLAVADGLGGHAKGEIASQIAVDTVSSVFMDKVKSKEEMETLLPSLFEECQDAIYKKQVDENCFDAMKTTLSVLVLDEKKAWIGYIGDTRIYYFHQQKLVLHTLDHSVSQMLVTTKKIKQKEVRLHPDRNRLLRVIGNGSEHPRATIYSPFQIYSGDAFLICSDGFWECMIERFMEKSLKKSRSVTQWLNSMNEEVKKTKKNKDNNTAIAVWIR